MLFHIMKIDVINIVNENKNVMIDWFKIFKILVPQTNVLLNY